MPLDVGSETWTTIDSWWDTFIESFPPAIGSDTTAVLEPQAWTPLPGAMDPWWDSYIEAYAPVQTPQRTAALEPAAYEDAWTDLDPWWDSYTDARQADIVALQDLLTTQTESWEASASRFDTDPLATDWTRHADTRGPLRPNQEENWSQWLAHLLRSGPTAFGRALFDETFTTAPERVQREVHLPNADGPDRYPDIILKFPDGSLSIEVKKNDEHYGKTTHTASLLEAHYRGPWRHILLLPEYKRDALKATFGAAFHDTDDQPYIDSAESTRIDVVYWGEVSRAIRDTLRSGDAPDAHWAASAYTFCTLIEQQLLQFIPAPTVHRMATAADVLTASQSLSVATGSITDQLEYLTDTNEDPA